MRTKILAHGKSNKKQWIKEVTSVNPHGLDGFAFKGFFIDKGETVDLDDGAVIISVGWEGSYKNGSFEAELLQVREAENSEYPVEIASYDYSKDFIELRDHAIQLLKEKEEAQSPLRPTEQLPFENPTFERQKIANQLILNWTWEVINFIKNHLAQTLPGFDEDKFNYQIKPNGTGYLFTLEFNGVSNVLKNYSIHGTSANIELVTKAMMPETYLFNIEASMTQENAETIFKSKMQLIENMKEALKNVEFKKREKPVSKVAFTSNAGKQAAKKEAKTSTKTKINRLEAVLIAIQDTIALSDGKTTYTADDIIQYADDTYATHGGSKNKSETSYYYKVYESVQKNLPEQLPAVPQKSRSNRKTRMDAVCDAYKENREHDSVIKTVHKKAKKYNLKANNKETEVQYKRLTQITKFFTV